MNIKLTSSHKKQEPESGCLYIVGTPIGNLSDLSYRAINVLKNVSQIACEDTRQTAKIMSKYNFKNHLTANINNFAILDVERIFKPNSFKCVSSFS